MVSRKRKRAQDSLKSSNEVQAVCIDNKWWKYEPTTKMLYLQGDSQQYNATSHGAIKKMTKGQLKHQRAKTSYKDYDLISLEEFDAAKHDESNRIKLSRAQYDNKIKNRKQRENGRPSYNGKKEIEAVSIDHQWFEYDPTKQVLLINGKWRTYDPAMHGNLTPKKMTRRQLKEEKAKSTYKDYDRISLKLFDPTKHSKKNRINLTVSQHSSRVKRRRLKEKAERESRQHEQSSNQTQKPLSQGAQRKKRLVIVNTKDWTILRDAKEEDTEQIAGVPDLAIMTYSKFRYEKEKQTVVKVLKGSHKNYTRKHARKNLPSEEISVMLQRSRKGYRKARRKKIKVVPNTDKVYDATLYPDIIPEVIRKINLNNRRLFHVLKNKSIPFDSNLHSEDQGEYIHRNLLYQRRRKERLQNQMQQAESNPGVTQFPIPAATDQDLGTQPLDINNQNLTQILMVDIPNSSVSTVIDSEEHEEISQAYGRMSDSDDSTATEISSFFDQDHSNIDFSDMTQNEEEGNYSENESINSLASPTYSSDHESLEAPLSPSIDEIDREEIKKQSQAKPQAEFDTMKSQMEEEISDHFNNSFFTDLSEHQSAIAQQHDAAYYFMGGIEGVVHLTGIPADPMKLSHILREIARVHRKNDEPNNLQLDKHPELARITRSLYEKAIVIGNNKRARDELNFFLDSHYQDANIHEWTQNRIEKHKKAIQREIKEDRNNAFENYFWKAINKYIEVISKLYPDIIKQILIFVSEQLNAKEFVRSLAYSEYNALSIESMLIDTIRLMRDKSVELSSLSAPATNASQDSLEASAMTSDSQIVLNSNSSTGDLEEEAQDALASSSNEQLEIMSENTNIEANNINPSSPLSIYSSPSSPTLFSRTVTIEDVGLVTRSDFKNAIEECLNQIDTKDLHYFYSHLLREIARVHRNNKQNLKLNDDEKIAILSRSLYEKSLALNPSNERSKKELKYLLEMNFKGPDAKKNSDKRIREYRDSLNKKNDKGENKIDARQYFLDEISKYTKYIADLYPNQKDEIYLHVLNSLTDGQFITELVCSSNKKKNIVNILENAKAKIQCNHNSIKL